MCASNIGVDILRETVEIARLIWKEDNVSYKGKVFSFENVTLELKPVEPIPIFCGGSTRALGRSDARRIPTAGFPAGFRWRPSTIGYDICGN